MIFLSTLPERLLLIVYMHKQSNAPYDETPNSKDPEKPITNSDKVYDTTCALHGTQSIINSLS
jgi:hypothetical protein